MRERKRERPELYARSTKVKRLKAYRTERCTRERHTERERDRKNSREKKNGKTRTESAQGWRNRTPNATN